MKAAGSGRATICLSKEKPQKLEGYSRKLRNARSTKQKMPMVRLPPVSGLSWSTTFMWTCKIPTWHIVSYASHAKGPHLLTRCYWVKQGETKSGGQGGGNKNTKSDNQKGTTELLHQRIATRNCPVFLSSPSESSRFKFTRLEIL